MRNAKGKINSLCEEIILKLIFLKEKKKTAVKRRKGRTQLLGFLLVDKDGWLLSSERE